MRKGFHICQQLGNGTFESRQGGRLRAAVGLFALHGFVSPNKANARSPFRPLCVTLALASDGLLCWLLCPDCRPPATQLAGEQIIARLKKKKKKASVPYLEMLETWIYHGKLNDQYGELRDFFLFFYFVRFVRCRSCLFHAWLVLHESIIGSK